MLCLDFNQQHARRLLLSDFVVQLEQKDLTIPLNGKYTFVNRDRVTRRAQTKNKKTVGYQGVSNIANRPKQEYFLFTREISVAAVH